MSEKTGRRKPAAESRGVDQERADERALFARYQADPTPANEELIIGKYLPLVYKIIHRFRFSSDQLEDLVQEGTKGLLLAIRRFDLSLNYRFSTYAWQTVQGEIQRYFRDRTWAINVPRDLKEKSLRVFNAYEELVKRLGQEPTTSEMAVATRLSEEEVQEAMELGSAYHPQGFTDNVREDDFGVMLSETEGRGQLEIGATRRAIFWESLLAHLTEVEAEIIRLYFFEQLTQKEIAERLATSQMNVSRIMRKALGRLRSILAPADIDSMGMV
jgi:RNA polymerase sigma-B factor